MIDNIYDPGELKLKYPRVYKYPIQCGFFCPGEWLEIIDRLSARIESYLSMHPEIDFRVDQVKEKFGGLRYYVNVMDPKIDEYILDAEREVEQLRSAS